MYTFVILWVPTLASMVPGGKAGTLDFGVFAQGQGWIFAAMMLCISLGGQVLEGMMKVTTVEHGVLTRETLCTRIATDAMYVCTALQQQRYVCMSLYPHCNRRYVCMYAYEYVYMYVYMYIYLYMYMHTHIHTYIYIYIYIYIYNIYIYIYIYIYDN
jgi:hypothetical protein